MSTQPTSEHPTTDITRQVYAAFDALRAERRSLGACRWEVGVDAAVALIDARCIILPLHTLLGIPLRVVPDMPAWAWRAVDLFDEVVVEGEFG